MKVKELKKLFDDVDDESELVLVVYTDEGYESGYIDRVDPHCKYNSVTGERLGEDESIVELTTSVGKK